MLLTLEKGWLHYIQLTYIPLGDFKLTGETEYAKYDDEDPQQDGYHTQESGQAS